MPGLSLDSLAPIFLSVDFVQASIRFSTPLIGAAVGEIVSEHAGVINIGLEGMMLVGAFSGVLGSALAGSVWGGVALALLAGGLIGLLHGVVSVLFGANQVVSGAAINLGALGLTTFLNRSLFGKSPSEVASFQPISLPVVSQIPVIGPILFQHIPLVYVEVGLALLAAFLLFRTQRGLDLRAIGEAPEAAYSAGIPVIRMQLIAVTVCGMMAGLAGTFFSLGNVHVFIENMTAGTGFIALAIVIVARWRPQYTIPVALLFGAMNALALRAQVFRVGLPYELLQALPYVVTLLVTIGFVGRSRMPASLGQLLVRD